MANRKKDKKNISLRFERFSEWVTKAAGSTAAFSMALGIVIIWAATGPFFQFSETWQLVINTGTTIITFLMVFLIQKSQNKEAMALQLKLNELLASNELASNRIVDVEDLTEEEIRVLQKFYASLARKTKGSMNLQESHSIEEANKNVIEKKKEQSQKRSGLKK